MRDEDEDRAEDDQGGIEAIEDARVLEIAG